SVLVEAVGLRPRIGRVAGVVVVVVRVADVDEGVVVIVMTDWRFLDTGVAVVEAESPDPSVLARAFCRARLVSVSRGTVVGVRLARIGRALNSRRFRSSSS